MALIDLVLFSKLFHVTETDNLKDELHINELPFVN